MCAIIDADIADQVFGSRKQRPEAGVEFFKWLQTGRGRLVTGGKNRRELVRTSAQIWLRQAVLAGIVRRLDDVDVDATTNAVRDDCKSNDPHVVALAQVSGARLLYSNDQGLHKDFSNKDLINQPRGKVYSTNQSSAFDARLRRLLDNRNLCGN